MKTKTILPALAITALAGAAVFLTTLTPSCDPQNETAESGRLSQNRAYAAAVNSAETREAARELPPEKTRAGLAAQRAEVERKARVRMARRRFLTDPSRWEPQEAEDVRRVMKNLTFARDHFTKELLGSSRSDAAATLARLLPDFVRKIEVVCGDHTKLTPAARQEWDALEATHWEGHEWQQPRAPLGVPVDRSATARELALAAFHAKFSRKITAELNDAELQLEIDRILSAPYPSGSGADDTGASGVARNNLSDRIEKIAAKAAPELARFDPLSPGADLTGLTPQTADGAKLPPPRFEVPRTETYDREPPM